MVRFININIMFALFFIFGILDASVLKMSSKVKREMRRDFTVLENALERQYHETFVEFGSQFLEHYKSASISTDQKYRDMYESISKSIGVIRGINEISQIVNLDTINVATVKNVILLDSIIFLLESKTGTESVLFAKKEKLRAMISDIQTDDLNSREYMRLSEFAQKYSVSLPPLSLDVSESLKKEFSTVLLGSAEELRLFAHAYPDYPPREVQGALDRMKITDFEIISRTVSQKKIPFQEIMDFMRNYNDSIAIHTIRGNVESLVKRNFYLLHNYRKIWGSGSDFESNIEILLFRRIISGSGFAKRDASQYVEFFPAGKYVHYAQEILRQEEASSTQWQ